jgi:SH3/ankyrin repeat-containing protein
MQKDKENMLRFEPGMDEKKAVLLQLKYKRRVYKMLNRDEKQLKALHTRANLRRLLDYVSNGQVEKITKMCSKGLDPNFHCHETGGE